MTEPRYPVSPWDRVRAAIAADSSASFTRDELRELAEFGPDMLAVDPDYGNRGGFDETFLGPHVPLPVLDAGRASDAAASGVLHYHHFSVLMSRSRRFALYTAANVDGRRRYDQPRAGDRWIVDGRLPDGQVDNRLYEDNDLDRGHLTRRSDMLWGDTLEEALRSVADTFHYTNCVPQHRWFNQNPYTWHGLEDYVLSRIADGRLRANVYTGPVFAADDPVYRDVRIPRRFWKVVAVGVDEKLHATAYLLEQTRLLVGLEATRADGESARTDGEPPLGAYRTYQTAVAAIETATGLDFGPLRDVDPYGQRGGPESAGDRELTSVADVIL
jgi:endonuclease G, mitochondrial